MIMLLRRLCSNVAIKILNLTNISNASEHDDKLIHWAKIFKAKTIKELEELAGEQEVFKNMVVELKKLSKDEKIRQQMEARADYESRLATARGAGYREGVEAGREEGTFETVINIIRNLMTKKDMSFDEACEMLSIEDKEKYRTCIGK